MPSTEVVAQLEVAIALPQSGRTRWLWEPLGGEARRRRLRPVPGGAAIALHRRSSPGVAPEALTAEGLAVASEGALAGSTVTIDDVHLLTGPAQADLGRAVGRALDAGAAVRVTSLVVPEWPFEAWARAHPTRWVSTSDLAIDEHRWSDYLGAVGVGAAEARRLHVEVGGWAGLIVRAAEVDAPVLDRIGGLRLVHDATERAAAVLGTVVPELDRFPPELALLPVVGEELLRDLLGDAEADAIVGALARLAPWGPGLLQGVQPLHPVLRRIIGHLTEPLGRAAAEQFRARALSWLLEHDRFGAAVEVLLGADRFGEALDLIRERQIELLYDAGPTTVRDLMQQLPRGAWGPDDHLLYASGCIAAGDRSEAAFVLGLASLASDRTTVEQGAARDVAVAYLGQLGHPPDASEAAARRALRLLEDIPDDAQMPCLLGVVDARLYRVTALGHLGRNLILLGRWDEALDVLARAGTSGHPLLDHALDAFRAWGHALRGDAAEAQRSAASAMEATAFWPELDHLAVEPRLALAESALLAGRWADAEASAAKALAGALDGRSAHHVACARVALAAAQVQQGDLGGARATLAPVGPAATGFVEERAVALRAVLLLDAGDRAGARALLDRRPPSQHTLEAHARAIVAGASPLTIEDLRSWEPLPWPSARQAKQTAIEVCLGVDASTGSDRAAAYLAERAASIAAAHDLTDREAEILVALAAGEPLTDTAASLYISTNTLKTHLRRVYRKLDVGGRAEAVRLVTRSATTSSRTRHRSGPGR
ncbi:MAG: LuxR C-terminal-related transcriptional regulator [Acidimicrobiales bacterium]